MLLARRILRAGASAVMLCTALLAKTPVVHDSLIIRIQPAWMSGRSFLAPTAHIEMRRPRLGLALSGGGLRGVAQIGVLKCLEENHIPIDFICGASIGSVVGGLYASGYTADEIWNLFKSMNWKDIWSDSPNRATQFLAEKQKRHRAILNFRLDGWKIVLPEALTPGQRLSDFLTNALLRAPFHDNDFSNLKTPIKIIATDMIHGEKVLLDHGDLAEAIRASIAVPLLLNPVEYQDYWLIDGGVLDNIPVEETRNLGADVVLAVNSTANLRCKQELLAPWQIADQVTTIMQKKHNQQQLAAADFLVDLQDLHSALTDAEYMNELLLEGELRTQKLLPQLRQLFTPQCPVTEQRFFIHRQTCLPKPNFILPMDMDTTETRLITTSEIHAQLVKIFNSGFVDSCYAEVRLNGRDLFLSYHLFEKPLLRSVRFTGNTALPDSALLLYFNEQLNKPLQTRAWQSACTQILKLYKNQGYSLAAIQTIQYDSVAQCAHINITEGLISQIVYQGNETTKNFVIAREFGLRPGDCFHFKQAEQGLANLYGTGLFHSVNLRTRQTGDQWMLTLHFYEKKYQQIRMGARYDLERQGRGFLELAHENLFGAGNELTLHGQYGKRDQQISLHFNANRIFKTYFTSQLQIRHDVRKYFYYEDYQGIGEYERRSDGPTFSIGSQLGRSGTLWGIMRSEHISIRSISGHGYDAGDLFINTLGINMIIDTRDRVPFPFSGKQYQFFYEFSSGKFLGAGISYFKVENHLASYWTFLRRNTLCQKLIWGTSDLTTPFSEQFRFGGEEEFYGLRDGELQGRHVILASWQYRYFLPFKPLWEMFLSLRFEVGGAWKNAVKAKAQDFINGRGICLSMNTPAGPLNFSYGRASNNKKRLYFSFGYNF